MNKQRIALIIVSILGMVSTFLPWAKAFGMSVAGTEGDGWLTLGIFIIPLVISFIGNRAEPLGNAKFACIAAGAVNAIIGFVKFAGFRSATSEMGMFGSVVSIGFGLYLLIIAGIAVCAVSLLKFRGSGQATEE